MRAIDTSHYNCFNSRCVRRRRHWLYFHYAACPRNMLFRMLTTIRIWLSLLFNMLINVSLFLDESETQAQKLLNAASIPTQAFETL